MSNRISKIKTSCSPARKAGAILALTKNLASKARRKKRKKKSNSGHYKTASVGYSLAEDIQPVETLGTVSSCPHCGAPIYSLHHVERGKKSKVQFSCNCRKYLKKFLEAKLQKYLSLEPLSPTSDPENLLEDQQEGDKEPKRSFEQKPR